MNILDIFTWSLLTVTITKAIPLIYAGIGGLYSERSGVVNICLEGIMLAGAFSAVVCTHFTGNLWFGLAGAIIAGTFMGLLHGVLSITFKVNQIVGGTAINIFAAGATEYLIPIVFGKPGATPPLAFTFERQDFFLSKYFLIYMAFLLVGLTHIFLYKTSYGLRVRAVGEHPKAADTVGINVYLTRYLCVIMSGIFAAIGGAYLSIGESGLFSKGMTANRGFIALAALIFGKWTPLGTLGACLFFGFCDNLQSTLQGRVPIPSEFMLMIPYVLTIVAIAGVVGRSRPPASSGVPYDPSER
ncbi:MAG TPA: ABC transporter permease [Candidatus Eremiobacteraeota bacterium]|nr:MAG: L-arabinose transporter permease protein [bacterium ADurb.Bin363]HPZ09245.1 ABC transporter permease [Candidatus Eremiobacteraeota bacterium]